MTFNSTPGAGHHGTDPRWRHGGAIRCLSAALLVLMVAGCGRSGSSGNTSDGGVQPYTGEYPYRVVTTCGMVSDVVREVAGDRAEVVGLMGEGVDPHLYKPTRNDVKQLMDADVVFYCGLMLEGRMAGTLDRIAKSGKPVFAVTERHEPSGELYLLKPEGAAGHWDPHVWMNVDLWRDCVAVVAERLAQLDPGGVDQYRRNAERYRVRLAELDAYVREVIGTIPDQQRVLVTAHDAFRYFSRAYGIRVWSIQGISTDSEAGVDDINALVDFLVERKIPKIFVESSVSKKNVQAVIEGAGERGWTATIGGQLYSDAMGPPGTYEGTYIGMIDHNATTITRSLGGQAPQGGFAGKLGQ